MIEKEYPYLILQNSLMISKIVAVQRARDFPEALMLREELKNQNINTNFLIVRAEI
jgi:hypothetical protein